MENVDDMAAQEICRLQTLISEEEQKAERFRVSTYFLLIYVKTCGDGPRADSLSYTGV